MRSVPAGYDLAEARLRVHMFDGAESGGSNQFRGEQNARLRFRCPPMQRSFRYAERMTAQVPFGLELPRATVWPDYGDGGLFGLVRSFADYLDRGVWRPSGDAETQRGRVLVFLLIDGLGDNFLQRFGGGGALAAYRRGRLTSVFPSTTASAVTTTMTGLAPAQHGLTGWFIRDRRFGGLLAPLPLYRRDGGTLAAPRLAERLFPYRSLYQNRSQSSVLVSPREIAWSRFSKRHARAARITGYQRGVQGLVDAIIKGVEELYSAGGGYLHAYYPHFDTLCHEFGSTSEEAQIEFWRVDDGFAQLLDRLAGAGCDVVVSADHGFTDTSEAYTVDLDAQPGLVEMLECPLWGERRAAFCAVRQGAAAEFEAAVAETFSGKAVVARSKTLVEAGLFGPGRPNARLAERVGTHTLLMEPGWTVLDRMPGEKPHRLIGVHGGLSPDEMWIPFIHATSSGLPD